MIKLSKYIFNRRSICHTELNNKYDINNNTLIRFYHNNNRKGNGDGNKSYDYGHRQGHGNGSGSGSGHHTSSSVFIQPGSTALDYEWSTFPIEDIPNILYQLNKRRNSNEKNWTTEVFSSIAKKLREVPGSYEFSSENDHNTKHINEPRKKEITNIDVAKLFFGLNLMPERHPCVSMINDSIAYMLSNNYNYKKYPWSAYNISCAMYHLRGLLCEHKHVRELLLIYIDLIGGTSIHLDSNSGSGFKNTSYLNSKNSNDHSNVIDTRPMSMTEFNNTIYGLQGLSSNTPVVRDLITVLLPHLERAAGSLKLVDIVIEGKQLNIKPSKSKLNPEMDRNSKSCIDNMFLSDIYALQKLSSEHFPVRKLIHLLQCMIHTDCVEIIKNGEIRLKVTSGTKVRAIQACRAIFGLQRCHMRNDIHSLSNSINTDVNVTHTTTKKIDADIISVATHTDSVRLLLDGLSAYFTDSNVIEGWMHPKDIALVLDGMRLMYLTELEYEYQLKLKISNSLPSDVTETSDHSDDPNNNNSNEMAVGKKVGYNSNLECIYNILDAVSTLYEMKAVSSQLNTDQIVRILYSFRGYQIDTNRKNDPIHQLLLKLIPYINMDVRSVNRSQYGAGTNKLIYRRKNSTGGNYSSGDHRTGSSVHVQGVDTTATPATTTNPTTMDLNGGGGGDSRETSKKCDYDGFQVACIKEGLKCILDLQFDVSHTDTNTAHVIEYKKTQKEIIQILRSKGIYIDVA